MTLSIDHRNLGLENSRPMRDFEGMNEQTSRKACPLYCGWALLVSVHTPECRLFPENGKLLWMLFLCSRGGLFCFRSCFNAFRP